MIMYTGYTMHQMHWTVMHWSGGVKEVRGEKTIRNGKKRYSNFELSVSNFNLRWFG